MIEIMQPELPETLLLVRNPEQQATPMAPVTTMIALSRHRPEEEAILAATAARLKLRY